MSDLSQGGHGHVCTCEKSIAVVLGKEDKSNSRSYSDMVWSALFVEARWSSLLLITGTCRDGMWDGGKIRFCVATGVMACPEDNIVRICGVGDVRLRRW